MSSAVWRSATVARMNACKLGRCCRKKLKNSSRRSMRAALRTVIRQSITYSGGKGRLDGKSGKFRFGRYTSGMLAKSAEGVAPAAPARNAGGKSGAEVREMFSRVARRYDFLNHFLSMGLDIHWRNVCAREVRDCGRDDTLADLCTGTGDLALALKQAAPDSSVIALDFTPEMAAFGPAKAARKKFERVTFGIGDSLNLPLRDNSVAAASVAFGIRNVADLDRGLREMVRVVRPGGKVLVLEFTKPS